jgi:phage terminase large subunit-like protein
LSDKILPKELVLKWISEVLENQYDITIYPKDNCFGEKFLNQLSREGWDHKVIDEGKVVINSNDPIKLARLSLKLKKQGFIIED